jgi:adenylate cyclase
MRADIHTMQQTANLNNVRQEEIRRLNRQIADLEGMLRAQHDLLRQRGMSIPEGVLEKLYYLRSDLEQLGQRLADESTELDQLRALETVTKLINSSLDPDEVLTEVVDTAIALTGAERGYIVLRSPHTGEMQFHVARDLRRRNVDESEFTVSRTVVMEAARTMQPVVSENAMMDPRYDPDASIVTKALRSVICVPLIYRGQVTGVLYADNRQVSGLFGKQEEALLVAFANQAAIAIENARLFDRARRALVEITEMKELMDNVFASIASGVITTDVNNIIVTYNLAAERILGVPYEQAVHQPLQSVLPDVFEGFDSLMESVRLGDRQQVTAIEPVLPGRGAVNLSLKLTPLKDAQGITYGMALVVDDLTEIKKSEATLNVVHTYLPSRLIQSIEDIDNLGLSGDEREITVIFADVRGFTTFSEQLPPELLMEIINHYLTVCSDAIQLQDGIIDKYMGDAVVGLFNTQLNPQDDHAERAVRAALTMAYDVTALHEVLPPEQRLFYGIGVDTGTAVLGNVGSPSRKEFTAIGAPFNFAKLLQENALAGETIISQNTYDRVQDLFTVEPLEPRKVKGRPGFQIMYRVTGVTRHRK